jgi:hypothetical protein
MTTPPPPSASADAEHPDLAEWARHARDVIAQAVHLMTLEQISQWEGVRSVLETYRDSWSSWQRAQSAPPAPHHALLKAQLVANEQGLAAGIGRLLSPPAPTFDTATYGMEAPQETPAGYHWGQTCRCQVSDCGCPARLIPDALPVSSASSFAERAVALGDELAAECNCFSCRPGFVEKVAAFAQQVAAESEAKYAQLVDAASEVWVRHMKAERPGYVLVPETDIERLRATLLALRSPGKSREGDK